MPRYNSRRHQKLMDESNFALQNASESAPASVSRIINSILLDSHTFKLWEWRHADLLLPIAEPNNRARQIIALRNAEVHLIHRRALFNSLKKNHTRGEERRKLFRLFCSSLDFDQAVLLEHRQFRFAVSSQVSADHLINVMNDPVSLSLLQKYENLYERYFEMKCYVAGMGDSDCIDLVRSMMVENADQLRELRRRIQSEPPARSGGSFDRQELLARSGRYPVLNYMVG